MMECGRSIVVIEANHDDDDDDDKGNDYVVVVVVLVVVVVIVIIIVVPLPVIVISPPLPTLPRIFANTRLSDMTSGGKNQQILFKISHKPPQGSLKVRCCMPSCAGEGSGTRQKPKSTT
jgi:hypothetical protein